MDEELAELIDSIIVLKALNSNPNLPTSDLKLMIDIAGAMGDHRKFIANLERKMVDEIVSRVNPRVPCSIEGDKYILVTKNTRSKRTQWQKVAEEAGATASIINKYTKSSSSIRSTIGKKEDK